MTLDIANSAWMLGNLHIQPFFPGINPKMGPKEPTMMSKWSSDGTIRFIL
jgi:hypothetical protein